MLASEVELWQLIADVTTPPAELAAHVVYRDHGVRVLALTDSAQSPLAQVADIGRQMASKLKVYSGPEHPHQAQQPVPYEITQVAQ